MVRSQFRRGRLLIIGTYFVLAVAYVVINPALASPDNLPHLDSVETLFRTRPLPVAKAQLSEYHQSPLASYVRSASRR